MDAPLPPKVLDRAASQSDRWPRALDPDYAKVDDRSLASLLDFACRFSSLVNYFGPDDTVTGDWVELFTRDPVVTMASIVATDLEGAERRLATLERRTRSARSYDQKRARLAELFDAALDLPRQINRWLRGMSSPDSAGTSLPWRRNIEVAIQRSLGERLQQLKAYDIGAADALGSPLGLDYSDFIDAWQLDGVEANASIYVGTSGAERIDRALPHLLPVWRPFRDAVARWAVEAQPQVATAFERGGFHQPHVALFVAFARLFATAQDSINSFAGRRTDFYFRRVLRERNRPAVPDTVYVAFTCANGKEPLTVKVPARTLLSAGKDAGGRDIVFESQDDISVTSAALARVVTIRIVSGPLIANDTSHVVSQRVLTRTVTPDRAVPGGWATFGSEDDQPAEMGFAVSSPALELAGGERTVALEFRCAPAKGTSADALAGLSAATGVTPAVVFDRLLEQAFTLSVSTAEGWLTVGSYTVHRLAEQDDAAFGLRFKLAEDAPAVACLRGSGVASAAPTVRADLRQERVTIAGPSGTVCAYPFSALEGLTVTSVTTRIEVARLPPEGVANMDGEVNRSRPSLLFGAVPTVGSYLRIRHPELFSKAVSQVALRIKWFGLPSNPTGFRGYYRRYCVDADGVRRVNLFDNQVFRASVTVERPGSRTNATPGDEGDHYLFRTNDRPGPMPDADDVLAKSTSLENLVVPPMPAPPAGSEPHGCLCVELTAPAYAFGHGLYQQNMMSAVMAEVPTDSTCDAACREEFSVLAEARRRLDALLQDVQRTWSLARVLKAVSPVHWLSRLAQAVHAAYLALTRSLPADIALRPDATSRSALIIRIRYADADFRRRSAAPPLIGRSLKHTVASRLNLTLGALLDAAFTCLSGCLAEWQDLFPRSEWHRLQQELTDARADRIPDRLTALRALHSRLGAATNKADADPGRQLLIKCDAVLQAASWVHDCEAGCVGSPRTTYLKAVSANLTKCTGAMQTLHDSVVKRCKEACLSPKTRPMPNPPYSPQVETVTIDYSASAAATLCHLLPHGGYRQVSMLEAAPPTLLPQFAHAANLYLGFSRVTAPQTLHLYVRLGQLERDGSAVPPVVWDALVANHWDRLEGRQVADATDGLQRSGIIRLAVPDDGAGDSTVLPGEYRWFRASVGDRADEFANTIGIVPHAVKAARQLSATGPDDLGRALPAHSIAGFVKPVKGIASVIQPSASFGGRPPETDRAFQTRLSERLRHKDRAILGWDYERLVLERFPAVWKVRTIPARRQRAGEPDGAGPGHVRVVIVLNPNGPDVADSLAPMASGDTLAQIEQTLRTVAGPFVRLQVVNPVYVRITVAATIRWREMADPGACAERLNAALIEYLSRWRTDVHGDGYGSQPEISAFIRSRADVEALVSIGCDYHPIDAGLADPERCVLTSAAQHDIRAFTAAVVEAVGGY